MATEEEIIKIAKKVAINLRNDQRLKMLDELKKYCKGLNWKEVNKVMGCLCQIRSFIFYIKRSFPNGRVNKNVVLKKMEYDDENYFALNVAIDIINEEEKNMPFSNYIHFEYPDVEYSIIDYSKYYYG